MTETIKCGVNKRAESPKNTDADVSLSNIDMLAHRPVVNGAVCHFRLASVVLIDCLGASVKSRLADAGLV